MSRARLSLLVSLAAAAIAALAASASAQPLPKLDGLAVETFSGARCAISNEGPNKLRLSIANIPPSFDGEDMVALALPWGGAGGGEPSLSIERVDVVERATGERTRCLLKDPPKSPGSLTNFVAWTTRNFSLKTGGFIGDVFAQGVSWKAAPESQRYRYEALELVVEFPSAPRGAAKPAREMHPAQRRRLERLVANDAWIDAARVADPPTPAGVSFLDWEFHAVRGENANYWRRFAIDERRVVAIGPEWIAASGLPSNAAGPEKLRVFKEGKEVPTFMMGDGRVALLATPSDSPYSLAAAYWVDASGSKPPLRMEPPAANLAGMEWKRLERARHEFTVDRDEEFVTSRDQFLTILDHRWVLAPIPPKTPVSVEFDLPQFAPMVGETKLRLTLYAITARGEYNGQLKVSLNGEQVGDVYFTGRNDVDVPLDVPARLLKPTRNELVVEDSLALGQKAQLHLDQIHVVYERDLYADTSPYEFSALADKRAGAREYAVKALASSGTNIFAIDAAEPNAPRLIEAEVDPESLETIVRPAPGAGGDFIVFGDFDVVEAPPAEPTRYLASTRAAGADAELLIVHHGDFAKGAARLAARREAQGVKTRLVDAADLYAEFSYGQQSPDAIRAFLAWQFQKAKKPPAALLLIGDATHDYRGEFKSGVSNFVPSYRQGERPESPEKFPVDLLFGCASGDDLLVDCAVARLSVAKEEDLDAILDKLEAYETTPTLGPWRASAGFVADSGGFSRETEDVRLDLTPPAFSPRAVYLEEHPWIDNFLFSKEDLERTKSKISPDTTTAIREMYNGGLWTLDFWGHGSPNIWSTQRMWFGGDSPNSDNRLLANAPRLPFVSNMTCNTAAIDYPEKPWNVCMTEDMMRQPNGGALAIYAPGGMGFTSTHKLMAESLRRELFDRDNKSIGDVVTLARWNYAMMGHPDGVLRMYILQGDPLTELQRPALDLRMSADGAYRPVGGPGAILSGQLPAELREGRFLLRATGADREPLFRLEGELGKELKLDAEGRWSRALPASKGAGRCVASLYAWNEEEKVDGFGGASWSVDEPNLVLESFLIPRPELADGKKPVARVRVANKSTTADAWAVPVVVEEVDALKPPKPGDWSRAAAVLVDVPAGEAVERDIELPRRHHASAYRASLSRHAQATPGADLARLVPPAAEVAWGKGEVEPGLYLVPALSGFEAPPRERDPVARGRFTALHIPGKGGEGLAVRVETAEGEEIVASPFPPRVEGVSIPVSFARRVPVEALRDAAALEFRAYVANAETREPDERGGKDALAWRADLFPDLEILAVRSRPERPTVGETVFFEVDVANKGLFPAESVQAFLYPGDADPQNLSPARRLPDRSESPEPDVAVPPGGKATLRARWDPSGVPAGRGVALVSVEMVNRSHEPFTQNNRLGVTVNFKSNFDLHFVGTPSVKVEPIDPSIPSVRLTATLENRGDTPADRVEVLFHKTRASLEDGEEPIAVSSFDRVGPGEQVVATFDWTVPPELARVGIAPVATGQIKGSRQRVSSTPANGQPNETRFDLN